MSSVLDADTGRIRECGVPLSMKALGDLEYMFGILGAHGIDDEVLEGVATEYGKSAIQELRTLLQLHVRDGRLMLSDRLSSELRSFLGSEDDPSDVDHRMRADALRDLVWVLDQSYTAELRSVLAKRVWDLLETEALEEQVALRFEHENHPAEHDLSLTVQEHLRKLLNLTSL